MKKVLVIETGGTFATESVGGVRSLGAGKGIYGKSEIIERVEKYNFEFEVIRPIFMLSEDMTFETQNEIIDALKNVDYSKYQGVILVHGTDTMAFTANLLSFLFGNKKIPVVMVGANHPIDMEYSNGTVNFASAIDFIFNVGVQGVYVIYRNELDEIEVHLGSRIEQMNQIVDGYFSFKNKVFGYFEDGEFIQKEDSPELNEIEKKENPFGDDFNLKTPNVLRLIPYVGLRYDTINLERVDAIVHGTFHSGTVNTNNKNPEFSINTLIKKAGELSIPVFVGEVESGFDQYESAKSLELAENFHTIYDTSIENLYMKVCLGLSKFRGEELLEYLNTDIFFEKFK